MTYTLIVQIDKMSFCVICENGGGKLIIVTDRGKQSLKKFAKLRDNENVLKAVNSEDKCAVHEICRKWFNNNKRIECEANNKCDNNT